MRPPHQDIQHWKTIADDLQNEKQNQEESSHAKKLYRGISLNVFGRSKSTMLLSSSSTNNNKNGHSPFKQKRRRRLLGNSSIVSTTSTESTLSRNPFDSHNVEISETLSSSSAVALSLSQPRTTQDDSSGIDGTQQNLLLEKKKNTRSFFVKSFRKQQQQQEQRNNSKKNKNDDDDDIMKEDIIFGTDNKDSSKGKLRPRKKDHSKLIVDENVALPKPKFSYMATDQINKKDTTTTMNHKKNTPPHRSSSIQGNTTSKGVVVVKVTKEMIPGTRLDVTVPEGTHTIPAIIPENVQEFNVYYTKQQSPYVVKTVSILRPGKYGEA